jgi:hypothetical protein
MMVFGDISLYVLYAGYLVFYGHAKRLTTKKREQEDGDNNSEREKDQCRRFKGVCSR